MLVCFLTGLILSVRCARGTTHDFQILKNSDLEINPDAQIKTDKGFLGIKRLFPKAEVPHKASKHHPLSSEQKQYNRQLASQRTLIEHRNRECKIFRICKDRYRGKHKNYEKTWKLVSAIVNLKLSTRHLKEASP
ncbi:MAG: transposase family protein [Acidobacteriota bacterium]